MKDLFERLSGFFYTEVKRRYSQIHDVSGDWTNHFSKKAVEIFDHYAGDTLIDLGYEKNREWINNIK